jgi:hypothetical protein
LYHKAEETSGNHDTQMAVPFIQSQYSYLIWIESYELGFLSLVLFVALSVFEQTVNLYYSLTLIKISLGALPWWQRLPDRSCGAICNLNKWATSEWRRIVS